MSKDLFGGVINEQQTCICTIINMFFCPSRAMDWQTK